MSSNRKRVALTIKEKVDIIARLKKCEKYGVGTSTISDTKIS